MRNALSMIWLVFYSLIEKTYKSTLHADPIRIEKRSLKAIISKMAVNDNFKHHRIMFLNRGILLKMTVPILFTIIFISPSTTPVQNASALASAVQITSAKADGSDFIQGAFVPIAQGKTSAKLTFEYRGFDDNDHVVELRCSWDGINYLKSNCSSESAESQSSFQGPDGVTRLYYVKTGTASRDISPSLVPKTYTFGVRVLNDNNNLGPATTWTFKIMMGKNTNAPLGGGQDATAGTEPEKPEFKKITVRFESITIHEDHDYDIKIPSIRGAPSTTTRIPGDWYLYAVVQGSKVIPLLTKDVYSDNTYQISKQVTVNVIKNAPLSIFTIGMDEDTCITAYLPNIQQSVRDFFPSSAIVLAPEYDPPHLSILGYFQYLATVFQHPERDWKTDVNYIIPKIKNLLIGDCHPKNDALGIINEFYQAQGYGEGSHELKSNSGDFTLRYTISLE